MNPAPGRVQKAPWPPGGLGAMYGACLQSEINISIIAIISRDKKLLSRLFHFWQKNVKFCQFKTRPKAGLSFDHRPQVSSNGRATPVAHLDRLDGYGVNWEVSHRQKPKESAEKVRHSLLVGLLGIEPRLHPPHGRVLPLYYSPKIYLLIF